MQLNSFVGLNNINLFSNNTLRFESLGGGVYVSVDRDRSEGPHAFVCWHLVEMDALFATLVCKRLA